VTVDPWVVFGFFVAAVGALLGVEWLRRLVGLMGAD
jgi:hypothetical protein